MTSTLRWCAALLLAVVVPTGCAASPPLSRSVEQRSADVLASEPPVGATRSEDVPVLDEAPSGPIVEPVGIEPVEVGHTETSEPATTRQGPEEPAGLDDEPTLGEEPSGDREPAPSDDAPAPPAPSGPPGTGPEHLPTPSPPTHPVATGAGPADSAELLTAASAVVLEKGHVDLVEVTVDGARLVVSVRDDTRPGGVVFRSPEQVQVRVPDRSLTDVPGGPFAFLGPAGSSVYLLPQVQDPDLVWPGWSTERLSSGQLVGDRVTMRLAAVQGPGPVAMFTTDQFGSPTVLFDSAGGTSRTLDVPIRTHAHASWAFRAPGVHRVSFEVTGNIAGRGPTTTSATYVFLVGDATTAVDPGTVPPPSTSPGVEVPPGAAWPTPGGGAGSAAGPVGSGEAATSTRAASGVSVAGASETGALASTGVEPGSMVRAAASTLLVGVALVAVARRRRRC